MFPRDNRNWQTKKYAAITAVVPKKPVVSGTKTASRTNEHSPRKMATQVLEILLNDPLASLTAIFAAFTISALSQVSPLLFSSVRAAWMASSR
jgi:hypothetical protein